MMEFPTVEKFVKDVGNRALDDFTYKGKSLREWVDILSKYECSEWIPVKKALPEKNMPVWVTTEWGEVTDGERWSDCKWFIGCGERNACNDDILAWMPYYSPKPYKGETP